jgi:two-component system CheB/CheR fusion protein
LAESEKEPNFWVGIGASAGGLEALRAFVRNVPRSLNATYIIAQHLSPHHRSMLPEILGRETDFECPSSGFLGAMVA